MPEQTFGNLLPSEDEITQIIAQTMQENPAQLPAILLRIRLAHLMVKAIDKLQDQFNETIRRWEDSLDNK